VKIEHNGTLMRIFVSESARYRHRDMGTAVVEALAAAGLAGAIAFKGIEGFGRRGIVSSTRAADAWMDLPVLIEVIDDEEKIVAVLPALEAILGDALVTLEHVQTLLVRSAGALP
jgi:PII-like signaling protein